MKCFYQGFTRPDDDDKQFNGYVSFAIPDIGIKFRGQYYGDDQECEYASLLALLEFIELNSHLFTDKRIEIFGNNFDIISQVNSQEPPSTELEQFCSLAQSYKKKFPFVLDWIPTSENMAQDGLTA
jgi:hypothetical protein